MDEWPEDPDRDAPTRASAMCEGDIVVTRVARHYALGRLNADRRTQTPLETQGNRAEALRRACELAGADHQVFIYELAGPRSRRIRIDCTETPRPES
jgi:hypothetical protein